MFLASFLVKLVIGTFNFLTVRLTIIHQNHSTPYKLFTNLEADDYKSTNLQYTKTLHREDTK